MKLLISLNRYFNRNYSLFKTKDLRRLMIFALLTFSFSIKGQLVINEVMVNPQTNATDDEFQSLKTCSKPSFGSEYIELYNRSACPLDISCYIIGYNASGSSIHGTFRFPPNTIVPPNGFISIGGPNSGATINLANFCSTNYLKTGADRWYLPNGDGYILLWDAGGVAIDAVYWTYNANEANKWGTDSEISSAPTLIAPGGNNCPVLSSLKGPSQIPINSSIVHYAGETPTIGSVIHRINDGSPTWETNGVATINTCNGKCQTAKSTISLNATISQPTCGQVDGSIDLNPTPIDNSYSYSWSKPANNTSKSASNLSQGSYTIRINNSKGCYFDTTIVLVENCGGCNLLGNVSVSPNSDCQPCNYVGPSIVINELNVFPNIGDGCIFGKSPDPPGKGEWIELFNPNWCDSLDISNYILGSYNSVNSSIVSSNGMAFILPKGLILPPLGFAVIRGSEAPKPPLGVIDVVVTNNGNNLCIDGGISSSRMWFANNGGWLALYNASGIPQDAIKWSFPAQTDLNKSPCIPLSNALPTGTTSLPSFNQISSLGLASTLITPTKGKSFRRFPDGGSWSSTLAAENSSYGTCNDIVSCAIFSDIAKCNGSATVNINSGVEPFTFQWNDPLKQTKQTATNLCEGTYNVVVTDANACSKTYNVVVGKGVFSITAVVSQPGCSISNGSINFNPPNYSYKWTPNVSTSNIANNLAKGVYTIVISEGSCSFDTTIVLQNPTSFSASVNSTKTSCGLNNGSAEIIVDTPGNYTFSWTPNVSSTKLADNLPAGDYFIAISDNNCEKILTASIDSSLPISAAIDLKNTFCNENNGVVQIDLSPLSNYSYSWTPNVSNSNIAQNLQTGSYNISFTDGICSGDTTVLVSSTPVVTDILYKITPTNCGTSNGAISVNEVLGGKMPFLFSFNEQQSFSSSTDTSGLSKKEYSVSVKDSNNCIFQKSFSISEIPGPNSIISEQTNPICGDSSGIILLKGATGGISPYSYKWDGQTTTNTLFSELTIGTYSVEVIDNYGCSFSKSIDLINDLGSASIFIPNVFTPNSDDNSVNEFWKVEASCVESISGVILNRWGDPVFKFDDLSDKWDGKTLSGDPVTDGVYFYKVSVSYLDDTNEILHGNITVIR